jgi:hypothetical protein
MPQNAEEAAYASFALLEARIKFLVSKGVRRLTRSTTLFLGQLSLHCGKCRIKLATTLRTFIRDTMLNRPRHPA